MKKVFSLFASFFLVLLLSGAYAQNKTQPSTQARRCATDEMIEHNLRNNPQFKAQWEALQAQFEASRNPHSQRTARSTTLTSTVTIPVVVHIVLPNPYIVTDADVQFFINRLNEDFSGNNPDSVNASGFYNVRGRSLIRFALAKRTPTGTLTNGIERKTGNALISATTYQSIKHVSDGGLDPWDVTKYYNVWVGAAEGDLLGIAPTIGVGNQTETTSGVVGIDGVCINYKVLANNSCYTNPAFNLSRTGIHEIGHNFGLYHSFQGGCSNTDFQQILAPATGLPASLLAAADDTPAQNTYTTNCPTGNQNTGCSSFPNPPGKMYQNYMDYTDDACYSMFTKGQVERMHYILENFRPGYLTTQGHLPPAGVMALNAAAAEPVNPGGHETIGCAAVSYPTLLQCGTTLTPKFRFRNDGTSIITSIRAGYILDNGSPVLPANPFSVNVPMGNTAVIAFPSVPMAPGQHTIKFFTYDPNGSADGATNNDTVAVSFSVSIGVNLPLTESFTGSTFPPNGWTLANADAGSITWSRYTGTGAGIPPGAPYSAPGSAWINLYDYQEVNQRDFIWSPAVNLGGTDSVIVQFRLSHRRFQTVNDTLELVYSADCGNTWQRLGGYYKWSGGTGNNALATVNPACNCNAAPVTANDWRMERVAFKPAALPGNPASIMIGWKVTNNWGNNIYIDDINIQPKYARDIMIVSINNPNDVSCEGSTAPKITVTNNGVETIRSYKVAYTMNNGTPQVTTVSNVNLASGASAVITLPSASFTPGQYLIRAYAFDLVTINGTGDQLTGNDTLNKQISVATTINAPLSQNFESVSFPPTGWSGVNPDNAITWGKATVGRLSNSSAYVNTFNYPDNNQIDELYTPLIKYNSVDSVTLKFDLSAATYSNPGTTTIPLDTLEILVTDNCGSSFSSVYKKWGADLQTLNDPNNPQTNEFIPKSDKEWRTERIDLSNYANSSSIMLVFRVISNYENNIYIDNVDVTTRTLPALLKQKGYLVLPTAFQNSFAVWHHQTPTKLKYITVTNSAGQVVYSKQFNGNAQTYETVELNGKALGVYFVHMNYGDESKKVVEKVIKQ